MITMKLLVLRNLEDEDWRKKNEEDERMRDKFLFLITNLIVKLF